MSHPLALALTSGPTDVGPDLTRYLLVCAGMVATVLLLGWVLQRTVAGNLRARAAKRALRVVDVLPLGGKKRLAVVRMYDRTFVLGVGDREITVVTELDREVEETELQPAGRIGDRPLVKAFEALRARIGEGRPGRRAAEPGPATPRPTTARPAAAARSGASRLGGGKGLLG